MKTFLLYILLLSSFLSFTQNQHTAYLDIGNVKALINSDGILFNDSINNKASFEAPKGQGIHSIYSSSFWMTALSQRNNLPHLTAGYVNYPYEYNGSIIQTGPVDIVHQQPDTSIQFQRVWKIYKSVIDNHIQKWNTSNYSIPASILEWPGNGNQNTAKTLAPFKDLDNDEIYEPQHGEYPLIEGDQAIFLMANNFKSTIDSNYVIRPRLDSNGNYVGIDTLPPAGTSGFTQIEIHALLYAYTNQSIEIENTVFVNLKLFNRSNTAEGDLQDFKFSVYTDFDLGNPADDYIGTDTARNLFFGYNGDNFDQTLNGYHQNLAAQGVKLLDQQLTSTMLYTRGNSNVAFVEHPIHIRNFQKGRWKNGLPLRYGGDGFYSNCVDTSRLSKFIFPGNPALTNDTLQWTEINPCFGDTTQSHPPGDRAMVGTAGLPAQFNHGGSMELNYAYVFAQDSGGIVASVAALQNTADSVQAFFDREQLVGLLETPNPVLDFSIYPNPTKNIVQLDVPYKNFTVEVFSIQGDIFYKTNNRRSISLISLNSGMYFIRITSGNKFGVKKLMITK